MWLRNHKIYHYYKFPTEGQDNIQNIGFFFDIIYIQIELTKTISSQSPFIGSCLRFFVNACVVFRGILTNV